ncbi:alkaline phosphatase family protein [Glaciecola sp. 1036]|uniref:alkaline phosphatase family protein n=1 Tax=Alteromonadaceae TaxID=72275 RepID=UPI003CFF83A8
MKRLLFSFCVFCLLSFNLQAANTNQTVILIGIDGLSYDAIERWNMKHLKQLADEGARAESLIPVFPSKTFPNFYAMATGLYPEGNGVVANNTYDKELDRLFRQKDGGDPNFFQGDPIWNVLERQGFVTASMFWVGSEASVNDELPTYWYKYDHYKPNMERVEQVLDWIDKETASPTFISLYFSILDSAQHGHGIDSKQALEAATEADSLVGALIDGLKQRKVYEDTAFVIVGDHGMADLSEHQIIYIDDVIGDAMKLERSDPNHIFSPQLYSEESGNQIFSYLFLGENVDSDKLINQLKNLSDHWQVYDKTNLPDNAHLAHPTRQPDIVIMPEPGWLISQRHIPFDPTYVASHGYDPKNKIMHATLLVKGKGIDPQSKWPSIENVNVHCIIAKLMDAKPAEKNDCDQSLLNGLMRP